MRGVGGGPTPEQMATATTTVFKSNRAYTTSSLWAAMRARGEGRGLATFEVAVQNAVEKCRNAVEKCRTQLKSAERN